MQVTYAASSNTATNGVSLGNAGQDVRVYKVLVGLPVANGTIALFNSAVAVGGATANLAWKLTMPSSFAAGTDSGLLRQFDFGPEGLPLDGGNFQIDQTMNVSVIWDYAPNAK